MSQLETRSVTAELRVATSADGTRTISGLIPYNSESVDICGFRELIAPGALASAFDDSADVLALRDHDPKLLLGRTKSGTLQLTDSAEGLRYTIKLPNTTVGNDLAESISRGDLDATSFGFRCLNDSWAATEDGTVIRTLLQVELIEVSPCSFAAYPDSAVSLRSAPPEIRSRIEQRDAPVQDAPVVIPPVIDEDMENLKIQVAIRSRK
jgi:HK97 family phage prohead protease